MNSLTLKTVDFHNQTLITLEKDNQHYVAMKPICENIGLDWEAQRQRIMRDEVLNSTAFMTKVVAEDGKKREMLCLPIQYLNGWLFGVDVSRVKVEIKDKLIMYKKECYQVLHDYWTKGVAFNPRLTSEQTLALRDAVNMATGVLKLDYSTIYKMIHQRFNVGHIKELSVEQLEQSVEYVHRLMCGSNEQEANYNAQWRLIGLLEYDRVSKELRQLQNKLNDLSQDLYRINRTKGLIYDAISEQRIHATDDYKQRLVEAQAFIAKQNASKTFL